MAKNELSYTYETKCKRCGNLNEWYAGKKEDFERSAFLSYIFEKSKYPQHSDCKKCEKKTFQDVVSFFTPE